MTNKRCFIAYWIDDYREKSIAIAIGEVKSRVLEAGIFVVLSQRVFSGGVGVQEHNDLSAREYEEIKILLEGFYVKWGIYDAITGLDNRSPSEADSDGTAGDRGSLPCV